MQLQRDLQMPYVVFLFLHAFCCNVEYAFELQNERIILTSAVLIFVN